MTRPAARGSRWLIALAGRALGTRMPAAEIVVEDIFAVLRADDADDAAVEAL